MNKKTCKYSLVWIYGMSGSGKTTISKYLKSQLENTFSTSVALIDGDNIRNGLSSDLGFSMEDRKENIRRVSEVAKLFVDNNHFAIVNAITPTETLRKSIKDKFGRNICIVALEPPLEVCIQRDPKGLYSKALNNEIDKFTGISSKYDKAVTYDIKIDTNSDTIEESVTKIIKNIV